MKTINSSYMASAAALMLASCANTDVQSPDFPNPDGRIVFSPSIPMAESRAHSVTKDDLSEFYVSALNPYDDGLKHDDGTLDPFIFNVPVEFDSKRGVYSSPSCEWPRQGHEGDVLSFFAFYPAFSSLQNTSTHGNNPGIGLSIPDFSIAPDIADQVDFIAAYSTGSMAANLFSGVRLDFRHQLSRIEVKAKGSNKSCKIEIAGVRIGDLYSDAAFNFKPVEGVGDWTIDQSKKTPVQYIFRPQDKIVRIDNTSDEVSIMGGADGVNYAMLLPASYAGWRYDSDPSNTGKNMYISVLLRVVDNKGKQQYPYFDNSQGLNALNIAKVRLPVDATGMVTGTPMSESESAPAGSSVKEFGWAALPVSAEWEAGKAYTFVLDYTSGVGLHDPSATGTVSPKAGDPIISDKVGVTIKVNSWGSNNTTQITVQGS